MRFLKPPKKSLGQNFLIDNNIINKIINIGNVKSNSIVLEIGPGYGNLTKMIINKKPKKIYAIEKDKKLSKLLKETCDKMNNIEIIHDDFLNIVNDKRLDKDMIVFGNLPYNISTKILASLILLKEWPPWYQSLILMFQKEVADRITAKKGEKNYGRLSILCNWRLNVKKHFNISKNCFTPKPKIDSTILSFMPKKNYKFNIKNPVNLETVTRVLFSNRRKMINKSYMKLFKNNEVIAKNLNLNLKKRPEELDNDMFYKLTIEYEKLFN